VLARTHLTTGREVSTTPLDLTSLTGRGVRVAVVDSGIDASHPRVGRVAGGASFHVTAHGDILEGTDTADLAGHGTACAGLIRKLAPAAELYSVRIFDGSLAADGRTLVAAIRWSAANRMHVVNLSLGTTVTAHLDELRAVCQLAVERGCVLVAAEHNSGRESYPAAFAETIGVAGGRIHDPLGYVHRPGHATECIARGDEQRLCWLNGTDILAGGTSFAAPRISAIVARILEAHPKASLHEVREHLSANAKPRHQDTVSSTDSILRPDQAPAADPSPFGHIHRAALYPFSKEMHAMVRFHDLLSFQVTGVADPVGRRLVGRDAGEAIGVDHVGVRISARLEDALADADTLVLGYVDQLSRMRSRDLLEESIRTALRADCNVFSFLVVPRNAYTELYELASSRELQIQYPDIPLDNTAPGLNAPDAMGPVDVPVLGVFGTGPQQGKFTLQLALRRGLVQRGYRVGQVGTEHHAALFGMDLAFPIGYAPPLRLPVQHYLPYLGVRMHEICRTRQPDIIVVGAQSGTVPFDLGEPRTVSLSSLAFLLGTKPDACVLVVNSIDPPQYIRHTIEAIGAIGKCPVILLAMSDREKHIRTAYGRSMVTPRQMSPEEIRAKLGDLEQTFALPAVDIASERGQKRAVEAVIEHFT